LAGLTLKNVYKYYNKNTIAVSDFNLEIKDGEFLVLVGPSGCGKSTTLRMVAGLEEVTKGYIYIGDKDVTHIEPKERDIAMVFQDYALYPHMSIFENMAFGLKLRKYPKDEIKQRVENAAEILGITHLLQRQPRQLSGGQRQRVALGRAIVRKPQVFLMDEPLSNLDAKLRVQMRAELVKLQRKLATTTIYVTHDQTEAMTMGDRIVVMKDGFVQQVGTPEEIYHKPSNLFVADFIGSPSMNFIEGKLVVEDNKVNFKAEGFNIDVSNLININEVIEKEVILGFRPENATMENPGNTKWSTPVNASVELVEDLGAEKVLFMKASNQEFRVKIFDLNYDVKVGQSKQVYLNLNKIHIFSKSDGNKIYGC
jgi:multiple sugar transport system ATP-binding protein